jgi:hypothetical protein
MTVIVLALWMGFPPIGDFPAATFKERWPAPFEEFHRLQRPRFQDTGPVRRYA